MENNQAKASARAKILCYPIKDESEVWNKISLAAEIGELCCLIALKLQLWVVLNEKILWWMHTS